EDSKVVQKLNVPVRTIYNSMVEQYGKEKCFSLSTVYKFLKSPHFVYEGHHTAQCDTCSKYGFCNIHDFKQQLDHFQEKYKKYVTEIDELKTLIDEYHKFLRSEFFSHLSSDHSEVALHCLCYLFASTKEEFGGLHISEGLCQGKPHNMNCA